MPLPLSYYPIIIQHREYNNRIITRYIDVGYINILTRIQSLDQEYRHIYPVIINNIIYNIYYIGASSRNKIDNNINTSLPRLYSRAKQKKQEC